jgi:hypothetical protein
MGEAIEMTLTTDAYDGVFKYYLINCTAVGGINDMGEQHEFQIINNGCGVDVINVVRDFEAPDFSVLFNSFGFPGGSTLDMTCQVKICLDDEDIDECFEHECDDGFSSILDQRESD